ncbi:putative inorganic phosphate cotransporter [Armadillidium vulgare]|nr:putative inorganic phosphate cotransporter [Armadillidium vulgare]
MYALLSTWIPKSESSRFIGSVLLANNFGSIFTLQVGGIIVSEFGYEMIFYASALMGLIWLLFWVLFMYDYPETHPRISEKERIYILENRAKSENGKKNIPWLKLFTSLRVWAICIAHAGSMFGLIFLVTQLPIYLSSVIGINIKANGFLSSLPFLARYFGSNFNSWLINFLMKKSKWTLKTWYRTLGEWINVYWFIFASYFICGLFFMIFLSTELQPWNEITEKPLQEDVRDIQELESLQKVCESNGLSTELQPLQEDKKDIHEEKNLQKHKCSKCKMFIF